MRPLSQSKLRELPRVKTHRVEDPPWAVTRNAGATASNPWGIDDV
jgi:hypothetical protein